MRRILLAGILALLAVNAGAEPVQAAAQQSEASSAAAKERYQEQAAEALARWEQRVAALQQDPPPDTQHKVYRNQATRIWQEVQADWEALKKAKAQDWQQAREKLEQSIERLELAIEEADEAA